MSCADTDAVFRRVVEEDHLAGISGRRRKDPCPLSTFKHQLSRCTGDTGLTFDLGAHARRWGLGTERRDGNGSNETSKQTT
jgi:hypothetical protein